MNNTWPTDMLVGAVRALQEEVTHRAEQHRFMATVCVPGCNHCCRWPVAASMTEGMVLVKWLISNRLWTTSLQERVRNAANIVAGLSYDVWRCADIPCPLLADNGMCMTWPARPIACRLSASVGPPAMCHPHMLPEATGIVPVADSITDFRIREAAILGTQGIKLTTMPLPVAILVAARILNEKLAPEQVDAVILSEYAGRVL